jgi:hypothetical protein
LPLGVFWYFHMGIFVWLKGLWSVLVFSRFVFNFFYQKAIGACFIRPNKWVASALFRWCLWHHPVVKSSHPLSFWMCSHVLFYIVWRV